MQVIGFYGIITSCNFQGARSSTLAVTRSQSCKMVMWGRVIQTNLVTWPFTARSGKVNLVYWPMPSSAILWTVHSQKMWQRCQYQNFLLTNVNPFNTRLSLPCTDNPGLKHHTRFEENKKYWHSLSFHIVKT